ncbi:hypothetical protein V496_06123 [Pseudogymnoascus sp. VKM F-4515 (FW-2607)]|nr:hypothetical protein V496_06123 [Pseudogymnoascus sp. VKM F-4515 (FW-2607)]
MQYRYSTATALSSWDAYAGRSIREGERGVRAANNYSGGKYRRTLPHCLWSCRGTVELYEVEIDSSREFMAESQCPSSSARRVSSPLHPGAASSTSTITTQSRAITHC